MSTLHELERHSGLDLASGDYWAQARLGVLQRWIDARHPEVIIDVGCGSGYLATAIDGPQRTVHGVDIDPDLIELANDRSAGAEFRVGDARDLAFDDNAADVVVLADLIEHFEDPTPVLTEAARVCRPDGSVIVSVPANEWLYGPHDADQGHARRYSPSTLREQADAAGLTLTRHRYTNFVPLVPYTVLQRVLKRNVPSSVRGGHSSALLQRVKQFLLGLEHRLDWPTGVTLLGELAPSARPSTENLVVSNYEYPPGCGGGGVFTRDLTRELRARGAAVHLIAGGNQSAWIPNGVLDISAYPLRSFAALNRAVRTREPDLIHGHFSLPTSLLLPVLKRRHDVPYVVSVMGADVHDPTRYRRLRPLMRAINKHWVFRHADRITVASSDMYRRIPQRHRDKTHVIPYFVDTDRYSPGERFGTFGDRLRLLTVARLVPRKNIGAAIDAVERLRDKGQAVKYTVAGSGSELDNLRETVTDRNLGDSITFTGYVPDERLVDLYRDHDVFVLPSVHEGFGIVLIEAMACGLPVVATARGGPEDIITRRVGRLVELPVADSLPAAVNEVTEDYAYLANGARQRAVEHYSIPTVVEQYRELYRSVTEDS